LHAVAPSAAITFSGIASASAREHPDELRLGLGVAADRRARKQDVHDRPEGAIVLMEQ
jgi:hypothetical protein